jgi:hypothetical protein
MSGIKADRVLCILLLAALLLFGGWLRVTSPPVTKWTPDERVYMSYARRAATDPLGAPREFVSTYNSSPANWIYPIPLRVGYYYLLAAIIEVWRVTPQQAGVALSTVSSIVELAMVAVFGLRFFDRWTVVVALALLSVSPQDLAVARRVWGDGVSGCAAMIFLWLCAEISVRPRARAWFAALWIWGAFFLLLKETAGFFFGFCILGLAIQSRRQDGSWKRAAWIITGAAGTAIGSFTVMALLCGGVSAALEIVRHNAQANPGNMYVFANTNGPWYSLPLGLWVLSPLTAFGCAAGLIALILPENSLRVVLSLNDKQRALAWGMGGIICLVIVAATVPYGLKNLRYMSFIVGPWYLMAALGLSYTLVRLKNTLKRRATVPLAAVAALALLLSCWSDYSRYRDMFIRRGLPDLDIRHMVTAPFDRSF